MNTGATDFLPVTVDTGSTPIDAGSVVCCDVLKIFSAGVDCVCKRCGTG